MRRALPFTILLATASLALPCAAVLAQDTGEYYPPEQPQESSMYGDNFVPSGDASLTGYDFSGSGGVFGGDTMFQPYEDLGQPLLVSFPVYNAETLTGQSAPPDQWSDAPPRYSPQVLAPVPDSTNVPYGREQNPGPDTGVQTDTSDRNIDTANLPPVSLEPQSIPPQGGGADAGNSGGERAAPESPYLSVFRWLATPPVPSVPEEILPPASWSGTINTDLTYSGNCPMTLSAQDLKACGDAYVEATNPSFEQRWRNDSLPWGVPSTVPPPSGAGTFAQPDTGNIPAAPQTQGGWGFAITDEERAAAEYGPPPVPKGASVQEQNGAYYSWLLGTAVPYYAKDLGNKALGAIGLR